MNYVFVFFFGLHLYMSCGVNFALREQSFAVVDVGGSVMKFEAGLKMLLNINPGPPVDKIKYRQDQSLN